MQHEQNDFIFMHTKKYGDFIVMINKNSVEKSMIIGDILKNQYNFDNWQLQQSKIINLEQNLQLLNFIICFMIEQKDVDNFKTFEAQCEGFSFQERYLKWESFLMNNVESPKYTQYLEKFIESYPFNYTYWTKLALQQLKKSKVTCLKIYQIGVIKNPKCLSLWKNYIEWLKKQLTNSDPDFLKKQLEKAANTVGLHYKSKFIHQYLLEFQTEVIKSYQLRKKILKLPIEGIEDILENTKKWISSLNIQQMKVIAKMEKNNETEEGKLREFLINQFIKIFEETNTQLKKKQQFELKITQQQYKPFAQSTEIWRLYIQYLKNNGKFQQISFIYERALISQCDNQNLWQQYFIYLEHDLGNTTRVLDILRNHSNFFRSMSMELVYYWIQIEERQSPNKARELFIQFQKKQPKLQTFARHIQLEIRCKQFTNAKTLYDTLLTVFSSNSQIISYVVSEYAEFALKYFRDLDFSKKLMKNYFDAYPYNLYLFTNYVQFYIKYVDLKEGNREVFQQFLNIILTGLRKAKKTLQEKEYIRISKIIKNYMRSYLITIYLIKTAQRKIKEVEMEVQHTENEELKRNSEYRFDMIETLSKKKKQVA